jgi:hypothetical protein
VTQGVQGAGALAAFASRPVRKEEGVRDSALFIGWGGLYPGRERVALEGYYEWVKLLEEFKQTGEIEDFMTFSLAPHGGDLAGFTLVFGDPIKLMQLTEREDVHRLALQAEFEFAKFGIVPAVTGKRLEEEFKLLEEEIFPVVERTPIAV